MALAPLMADPAAQHRFWVIMGSSVGDAGRERRESIAGSDR
jgi:hypothetical protein